MSRRFPLVLHGRVLERGSLVARSVAVASERIVEVGRRLVGDEEIDFGDRVLLPGATDIHVHLRDPGHPAKEDFGSGTLAAAFGGVTAVLDMPNTDPPTTSVAALDAKIQSAGTKAHVDFGVYAGLSTPESAKLLERATAMKAYLGATTGTLLVKDDAAIRAAFAVQAKTGKLLAFHAEANDCLDAHGATARQRTDPLVWSDARPASCEANAIRAVRKLRPGKARAHIAHLSSKAGLAEMGPAMTSEATPHHLLATRDDLAKDARWKMNPPLRTAADRDALWRGLLRGTIPCVASDHAPHTTEEKARGIWDAPAGVPGVETMVPLLLAEFRRRRAPLERFVEVTAANPARIAGLPKGRFVRGFDADIAVYDLAREVPVRAANLHSRCGWTPYEGRRAIFPTDVMLRGGWVVRNGALEGKPGTGRFLPGGRAARG